MKDHPETPVPRPRRPDGELHFHYNREEREAERQVIWTPPSGGFFRRNRALAIILVDVIVVVLLFFIYIFFLRPLEGQVTMAGYRVSPQLFELAEDILVTVTITPVRSREQGPVTQPVVTVTVARESVSDLAPLPDRERTIAVRFPRDSYPAGETITVEITIGDEHREVNLPLD